MPSKTASAMSSIGSCVSPMIGGLSVKIWLALKRAMLTEYKKQTNEIE